MTDFYLEIGFREDDLDFLDLVSVRVEATTKAFIFGRKNYDAWIMLSFELIILESSLSSFQSLVVFSKRYLGLYYPLIGLLWGLFSANVRIPINQSSISWIMSYQGFDVICSFAIPHAERVISRKPMMLSVWPYRVQLLRRPVVNLLLPHGHQQRLRSSQSAWNLGDLQVISRWAPGSSYQINGVIYYS